MGRLSKAHGLKGELKFYPFGCERELLLGLAGVHLGPEARRVKIDGIRGEGKFWIVALKDVGNRAEAEKLENQDVWIPEAELPPPPPDEIYVASVIDARVIDESGRELGVVEDVLETVENDVLIVKQESGEEELVPALRSILRDWNESSRTLTVRWPLEENSED